jgi:hypothetical protein
MKVANRFLTTLALALLVTTPLSGQTMDTYKLHMAHVQGRGCVHPVKEGHPAREEACFLLHEIKTHRYYNLYFDGTEPEPDTAIWFEEVGYSHEAGCKQGQPVHVSHWKPMPGKCPKPASTIR